MRGVKFQIDITIFENDAIAIIDFENFLKRFREIQDFLTPLLHTLFWTQVIIPRSSRKKKTVKVERTPDIFRGKLSEDFAYQKLER